MNQIIPMVIPAGGDGSEMSPKVFLISLVIAFLAIYVFVTVVWWLLDHKSEPLVNMFKRQWEYAKALRIW